MFFRMNFALFFRFFDSWYIISTYWLRPRESSMFVDPRLSMFPLASPRETSTVSGPQNILFPSVSVNKYDICILFKAEFLMKEAR